MIQTIPSHQTELKKAQRALKHVGCTLVPFYDREVTIIVSRRPFDANKDTRRVTYFTMHVVLRSKFGIMRRFSGF